MVNSAAAAMPVLYIVNPHRLNSGLNCCRCMDYKIYFSHFYLFKKSEMGNGISDQPLESSCLSAGTVDSDSSQSSMTPAPSPGISETSSSSSIPSSVPPTPPPKSASPVLPQLSATQRSLPRQGTSNPNQAGFTSSSDETGCPPSYVSECNCTFFKKSLYSML